jgi:type IV secretion system protein VirD4
MARDLFILLVLVAIVVYRRRRGRRRRYHEPPRAPLFSRRPPRYRSRWLRMRLHLRLHPGPGLASVIELLWHWGRWASYRESRRTRPSLGCWQRICHPAEHSLFLGRAQYLLSVRVPVQEHGAIIGPPRSGKSALLSRLIMAAPGPVVSTSSKPDLYALTSVIRANRGPVWVFNPQGIGGIPSNVRWSPVSGCHVPATAIRRGAAFAASVSTQGTEESGFWRREAGEGLQGLFAAAALAHRDMRTVGLWAGSPRTTPEAAAILAAAGHQDWSDKLAELNGPAEKTAQTIRTVMTSALSFLRDPVLAAAVLPCGGGEFDVDEFLASGGTLYMLARSDGDDSALGPLFAALASEIQHRAAQVASQRPGGRLDPPLLMALDEVTQICPVPLPGWLATPAARASPSGLPSMAWRRCAPGGRTRARRR